MKPFLTAGIIAAFLCSVPAPAQGRRLQDLNVISPRVLQRSISPKFYKSLLISPVEGWIVVRANLVNGRFGGARIARSELNGAYDALALKFANDLVVDGYYDMENPQFGAPVLLHLLVYQIADGTMVLAFPTLDEPGGNQMFYWGCARLGVIKSDGRWVEIEGPEGLHGKGWAVRPPNPGLSPAGRTSGNPTPPRPKHRRPTVAAPSSSLLAPIIASRR